MIVHTRVDQQDICIKTLDNERIILTKWELFEGQHFSGLYICRDYACAMIVHIQSDQLLPKIV